MWADWSTTSLLPSDCGLWGMGAGEVEVLWHKTSTARWLPSKQKITLANLAKVDKFLLAK